MTGCSGSSIVENCTTIRLNSGVKGTVLLTTFGTQGGRFLCVDKFENKTRGLCQENRPRDTIEKLTIVGGGYSQTTRFNKRDNRRQQYGIQHSYL